MKMFLIEVPDKILVMYPKSQRGGNPAEKRNFIITEEKVTASLVIDALVQKDEPGDPSVCFSRQKMDKVEVIELTEEQTDFRNIPLRKLYRELCDISHLCDDLENLKISGFLPIIQLAKMEKQKRLRVCINRIKNTSLRRLMTHIRYIPTSPSPDDLEEEDSRLGLAEWRFRMSDGKERDFYSLFGKTKLRNLYRLLEEENFIYAHELREEIQRRLGKSL